MFLKILKHLPKLMLKKEKKKIIQNNTCIDVVDIFYNDYQKEFDRNDRYMDSW